jgi:AcrR family transcriptional regulator
MATFTSLNDLLQRRFESLTVRRLLLAAVDSFWRNGFHASSTRDIAKRAELSPAAVYVHFASKEDLLFTIISTVGERLRERLQLSVQEGGGPTELLGRLVYEYVAFPARMYKASFVANRDFKALTPKQRTQIVKIRDDLEKIIEDCLRAGAKNGEFVIEDIAVTRMAILSLCRSVLHWYSPRGRHTPEQIASYYVNLVFRMVRQGAGTSHAKSERSAATTPARGLARA